MERVSVAIIGVGIIGRYHAECISKINEIDLKVLVDVNEELVRKEAERFKVEWCTDYTKILDRKDIDAAIICTPHHLHAPIAIDFMKAGKHVLVEKPMARTVRECDEMINTARKCGVKLGIVFQHRTHPHAIMAKRFIDEGKLGSLYRASLEYVTFRSQGYYESATWRGRWATEGGGVLINQAIHFIDLFQWFVGLKPVRLVAFINNLFHNIEVEDIASAIIEFENGAQGIMQFSTIDSPHYTRIVLRGTKALLIYEEDLKVAVNEPPIDEGVKAKERGFSPKFEWHRYIYDDLLSLEKLEKGHRAVLRDFARAIIEDKEPMVTGEEGRKSVEIANAIVLSGVTGKEVRFPINKQLYDKVINQLSQLKRITKLEV